MIILILFSFINIFCSEKEKKNELFNKDKKYIKYIVNLNGKFFKIKLYNDFFKINFKNEHNLSQSLFIKYNEFFKNNGLLNNLLSNNNIFNELSDSIQKKIDKKNINELKKINDDDGVFLEFGQSKNLLLKKFFNDTYMYVFLSEKEKMCFFDFLHESLENLNKKFLNLGKFKINYSHSTEIKNDDNEIINVNNFIIQDIVINNKKIINYFNQIIRELFYNSFMLNSSILTENDIVYIDIDKENFENKEIIKKIYYSTQSIEVAPERILNLYALKILENSKKYEKYFNLNTTIKIKNFLIGDQKHTDINYFYLNKEEVKKNHQYIGILK